MGERKKRNLCAYYFSFDATGVDAVDEILEKVAMAGSGYHHTSDWNEEYVRGSGVSVVDEIQNAANDAAEQWNTRASQWVSVDERLPHVKCGCNELVLTDTVPVRLSTNNPHTYFAYCLMNAEREDADDIWIASNGSILPVAFWFDLPPPPTAEAGE